MVTGKGLSRIVWGRTFSYEQGASRMEHDNRVLGIGLSLNKEARRRLDTKRFDPTAVELCLAEHQPDNLRRISQSFAVFK